MQNSTSSERPIPSFPTRLRHSQDSPHRESFYAFNAAQTQSDPTHRSTLHPFVPSPAAGGPLTSMRHASAASCRPPPLATCTCRGGMHPCAQRDHSHHMRGRHKLSLSSSRRRHKHALPSTGMWGRGAARAFTTALRRAHTSRKVVRLATRRQAGSPVEYFALSTGRTRIRGGPVGGHAGDRALGLGDVSRSPKPG